MSEQSRKTIHPEAKQLVDYWYRERGDRLLPGKTALDPTKLKRWLGDLSITELQEGPKRFFVRLHGGNTRSRVGTDMTRRYFEDELPDPEAFEFAVTPYQAAEKARLPTHSVFVPRLYPGVFTKLERLVLPFSAERDVSADAKVDQFLTWVGPTGRQEFCEDSVYAKITSDPSSGTSLSQVVELEILSI